jgi:hypothetical protein
MKGDAGVLIGYGTVQGIVDSALMPLASAQPELFTQDLPVLAAPLQSIVLAALWVSIGSSVNGCERLSCDARHYLSLRHAPLTSL